MEACTKHVFFIWTSRELCILMKKPYSGLFKSSKPTLKLNLFSYKLIVALVRINDYSQFKIAQGSIPSKLVSNLHTRYLKTLSIFILLNLSSKFQFSLELILRNVPYPVQTFECWIIYIILKAGIFFFFLCYYRVLTLNTFLLTFDI